VLGGKLKAKSACLASAADAAVVVIFAYKRYIPYNMHNCCTPNYLGVCINKGDMVKKK
jgi:hypothetical protein